MVYTFQLLPHFDDIFSEDAFLDTSNREETGICRIFPKKNDHRNITNEFDGS